MKSILLTLLILLPGVTSAYTGLAWGSHSQVLASVTISNTGSVNSVTSSSASTGGNSAGGSSTSGSAGSVTTGSASASTQSEVHTDGDGTAVHLETETTVNGETKREVVDKVLNKGESVSVETESRADASTGKTSSKTVVESTGLKGGLTEEATTTATTTDEAIVTPTVPDAVDDLQSSFVLNFTAHVATLAKQVLSWLWFW